MKSELFALTVASSMEIPMQIPVPLPAMRGKMGSRTYYSVMMPLNAVPQFFKFTDWSGMLPEDREQRVLVEKRIPNWRATSRKMRTTTCSRRSRLPTSRNRCSCPTHPTATSAL